MATQRTFLWFQIVYAVYQDSSPTNIKIFQSQLYRCRCATYWCHEYFVACFHMPVNLIKCSRKIGYLISSTECDVTGPLWSHNKAVSYRGWDYKNQLHLDVVDRYLRFMGDKTIPDEASPSLESFCLVHPGVRDKRRVSEIDLSQPRHETVFWWRHNGPMTSQFTDPIKWPNQPLELIEIFEHINTHNKESLTQRCRRSANVQLCLVFLYISIWFES